MRSGYQGNRPTASLSQLMLGAQSAAAGRRRAPRPGGGRLLFVLPVPLLIAALLALGGGRLGPFAASAGTFVLFMAAAYLTRRGLQEPAEPPARLFRLRRRLPRPPLQDLGGGVLVLATGIAAFFAAGHGLAISIAFAAVAAVGFHLLYGFVPLPRALRPAIPRDADKDVAAALEEAEGRIQAIEEASTAIGNVELRARLGGVAERGRRILARIAERPQSLRRARKFLTVYLEGAQQVTEGYARTHRAADSRELEENFRNVLVTIDEVFAEQEKKLLESDVMDLDVQIEVLTKQLKREGIV